MNRIIALAFLLFHLAMALQEKNDRYVSLQSWKNQTTTELDPVEPEAIWSWKSCGSPGDPFVVQSINISPDPPKRGQKVTVNVAGHLSIKLQEGAKVVFKIKSDKLPITLKTTIGLCGNDFGISCPVYPGPFKATALVNIPSIAPKGHYHIEAAAYNSDGKKLTCLEISVKLD